MVAEVIFLVLNQKKVPPENSSFSVKYTDCEISSARSARCIRSITAEGKYPEHDVESQGSGTSESEGEPESWSEGQIGWWN